LSGLDSWGFEDGIVIKSDALAGGKGVVLCDTRLEAEKVLFDFMKNPAVSVQTDQILFEKKLHGRELSAFALLDGQDVLILGYACDYKRIFDGDKGPNTGGMGTYTPADIPNSMQEKQILEIAQKVNQGMLSRGTPYQGILFIGLMLEGSKTNVIEFNIRFGDPETQSLLLTLDADLFTLLEATATGKLSQLKTQTLQNNKKAVHIVLASQGYPSLDKIKNPILTGQKISLPSHIPENAEIFFAGVTEQNGDLLNSGGRVLGVSYLADSLEEARVGAYQLVKEIEFKGQQYRTDIAKVQL
jgi:phosphoribosylamine--glycine ligase